MYLHMCLWRSAFFGHSSFRKVSRKPKILNRMWCYNVFTLLNRYLYMFFFSFFLLHYTYDFILLPFSSTVSLSVHVFSCDWNWYWRLFCFCCHIQHTLFGGSVWLYEAVLLVFALHLWSYLVLMYYVLYRVLSYWYLLCSHRANFYVIHRQ